MGFYASIAERGAPVSGTNHRLPYPYHPASTPSAATRIPCAIAQSQQCQGVGLIVVGRDEAEPADGGDHSGLVGVPAAREVPLDRSDRNALVRHGVKLGPCGERGGHAEDVARIGARVAADLLEPDAAIGPDGRSISASQL